MRQKSIEEFMGVGGGEQKNLEASLLTLGAMKLLPGGTSLIVAGAVRRSIKNILERSGAGKSESLRKLEEFMLYPERYVEAAEGAKTPKGAATSILTKLVGASQAAELLKDEEK